MLEKLAHRGPDGTGHMFSKSQFGALFLGNSRLAIVDVPGGTQPYAIDEAGISCVFNGEIYNHSDLRDSLKSLGHVFKSKSDGEVIPHLYQQFGIDGFRKIAHRSGKLSGIERGIIRGAEGAAISGRKVWKCEVKDYAKGSTMVISNIKVREAIDTAIAAIVRAGVHEIDGVRIWEDVAVSNR